MILSEYRDGKLHQTPEDSPAFVESYDVIIAGLGTSGSIAAIRAAELGLKVLGLDKSVCMGGTHIAGAIRGYYFGSPGGRYEAVDGAMRRTIPQGFTSGGGMNPSLKGMLLERAAMGYGVDIRYESTVTGVYLKDGEFMGIRWKSPDSVRNTNAKIIIDCTGNMHICRMAGCKMQGGRSSDGQMQTYSLAAFIYQNRTLASKFVDNGYVDPYDGDDFTEKVIDAMTHPSLLKDRYSPRELMVLPATLLGIREGKRIVGEKSLTFADFINGCLCEEPLFYAHSNLDSHSKDVAFESDAQIEWNTVANLFGINFSVPVPAGAMIPKGFDGILAAGRGLSADHEIASCVRMNRDMQKCGEAAAAMAHLAVRKRLPLRDIPYGPLKELLRSTGCLDEANNRLVMTGIYQGAENGEICWITDYNEMREGLRGERPGLAIWSARRIGAPAAAKLSGWLDSENENLRKHSALALGLMDNSAALPVIRQMIIERDPYIPKTSRKYNMFRGVSAIYLAGKLLDEHSAALLAEIVCGDAAFESLPFEPDEFVADRREMYFQYFSFAMMSLIRIGNAKPFTRAAIAQTFQKVLRGRPKFTITLKSAPDCHYDMSEKIAGILRSTLKRWADQ